jgi:hypothetical protein
VNDEKAVSGEMLEFAREALLKLLEVPDIKPEEKEAVEYFLRHVQIRKLKLRVVR